MDKQLLRSFNDVPHLLRFVQHLTINETNGKLLCHPLALN